MNVFFDTNVLLDVLRNRAPFVRSSQAAWLLAEQGTVTGLVSALSYSNIFYIVRKLADGPTAIAHLRLLRRNFSPVACTAATIDQALAADFTDFEDAVQYFSALAAHADCILTRNTDDFRAATIPVLTPDQFLATLATTTNPPGMHTGG